MSLSPVNNSPGAELESIFFGKGVEGTLPDPELAYRLPDFNCLQPPAVIITSQIDQMLGRSNIEDIVLAVLQPQVLDRLLMRPERFNAALEHSLEALRYPHDDEKRFSSQLATRVYGVLQEEIGLRKLLDSFRNALLQA